MKKFGSLQEITRTHETDPKISTAPGGNKKETKRKKISLKSDNNNKGFPVSFIDKTTATSLKDLKLFPKFCRKNLMIRGLHSELGRR